MWECPKCKRQFKKTNQSHFCVKPENVEDYISSQDVAAQPFLREITTTVREAAPDATEKISQHMPTFWQKKNIVQFAAHKNHIGFYPGDAAVLEFDQRLSEYKTNKGCIHLPYDKPLDCELIVDIVKWKVKFVEGTT